MSDDIRTIPDDYEALFELPGWLAYKVAMGQDGHVVPEGDRRLYARVLRWMELDLADVESVFKTIADLEDARGYFYSKCARVFDSADELSDRLPQGDEAGALREGVDVIVRDTHRLLDEVIAPALSA